MELGRGGRSKGGGIKTMHRMTEVRSVTVGQEDKLNPISLWALEEQCELTNKETP